MLFTIVAALAQIDHEIKRERVTDSLSKRREAGKDLGGRPRRVTDVEAQDFPAPVRGHAEGDHDRLRQDAVPDAGLAVDGFEEHIRVVHGGEVAVQYCFAGQWGLR